MKTTIVIVAGGSGTRMKSEVPKQFIELNGEPILMHTLRRFYQYNPRFEIRVVLPKNQMDYWQSLIEKHDFNIQHQIFSGGETRFHSVLNGLEGIEEGSIVAIHDGVRPFVSSQTLEHCFTQVKDAPAVIPVIDVYETIRELKDATSFTVPRDKYKLVQTPQVFQSDILLDAYAQPYTPHFTDDASVVESLGNPVVLVPGNRENIKITTPEDLWVAQVYSQFVR